MASDFSSSDQLLSVLSFANSALARRPQLEILTELLSRIVTFARADLGLIQVVDGDELIVLASTGCRRTGPEAARQPVAAGPTGEAVTARRPVSRESVSASELDGTPLSGEGVTASISVPLALHSQVVGALTVATRATRPWAQPPPSVLEAIAGHAVLAVERHRLLEAEGRARRDAEAAIVALQERDRRFRAIFDATFQFIGLLTVDGRVLEVNRSGLLFAGLTAGQVQGQPFWETPWWIHDPRQQQQLRDAIRAAAAGAFVRFETTHPRPDGTMATVDFSIRPVRAESGDVILLVPEGRDITERKAMEEELREARDRLRDQVSRDQRELQSQGSALRESEALGHAVVSALAEGVVFQDADGVISLCNPAAERILGTPADQLLGRATSDPRWQVVREDGQPFPPEQYPPVLALRTGLPHTCEVLGFVRQDGSTAWLQVRSQPLLRPGDARPYAVVTTFADITARRQAEARMRLSEAINRSIVDTSVQGIIVIDERGRMETFNPGAERIFAYSRDEVLGENIRMLMASPDRERHDDYLRHYREGGTAQIIGVGREVTGRRKDGSEVALHLSVSEMWVEGERKFTGMLTDLTERKRAEALLQEQAALARLGQMAAVVAHEVRNPLAGIRGAVDVIRGRLPVKSGERPILTEIIGRIDALSVLVDDILVFARPRPLRIGWVNARTLLGRAVRVLESDPANSGLDVSVEGPDAELAVDGDQMYRVFFNLLMNAAQAMGGQGAIRVRTEVEGDRYRVTVRDEGPGIPEEVRDRLFEPFFTTKSRGSGLGLSIARRAVEGHRGSLRLESTVGAGTTVTVEVPLGTTKPGLQGSQRAADPA